MAFKRIDNRKGISLPGLIDVIFLLLIFSLVTLSISETDVQREDINPLSVDIQLPETLSPKVSNVSELLTTLTFEIDHLVRDDKSSPKALFVLTPNADNPMFIKEARDRVRSDSSYVVFPVNFLELNDREFKSLAACQAIDQAILDYKNEHFTVPRRSNTIEIRAVKNTEFRIFNYIMDACSAYGDTIPNVIARTLLIKR